LDKDKTLHAPLIIEMVPKEEYEAVKEEHERRIRELLEEIEGLRERSEVTERTQYLFMGATVILAIIALVSFMRRRR